VVTGSTIHSNQPEVVTYVAESAYDRRVTNRPIGGIPIRRNYLRRGHEIDFDIETTMHSR